MPQDFSKRISIAIDSALPNWQVLNVVAHISAYFGNQLGANFGTGKYFESQDGILFPRNSQYPIIALSANAQQLPIFAQSVREAQDVQAMFFIREMIETTDDQEIVELLSHKSNQDVELLGVGIFGENQRVKELTKAFKLWS